MNQRVYSLVRRFSEKCLNLVVFVCYIVFCAACVGASGFEKRAFERGASVQ
jgi:hypothetical protein